MLTLILAEAAVFGFPALAVLLGLRVYRKLSIRFVASIVFLHVAALVSILCFWIGPWSFYSYRLDLISIAVFYALQCSLLAMVFRIPNKETAYRVGILGALTLVPAFGAGAGLFGFGIPFLYGFSNIESTVSPTVHFRGEMYGGATESDNGWRVTMYRRPSPGSAFERKVDVFRFSYTMDYPEGDYIVSATDTADGSTKVYIDIDGEVVWDAILTEDNGVPHLKGTKEIREFEY